MLKSSRVLFRERLFGGLPNQSRLHSSSPPKVPTHIQSSHVMECIGASRLKKAILMPCHFQQGVFFFLFSACSLQHVLQYSRHVHFVKLPFKPEKELQCYGSFEGLHIFFLLAQLRKV